jgi:hypothetical protein
MVTSFQLCCIIRAHIGGSGLTSLIAAIFIGNVMTAAFLAAMSKALRPPNDEKPSWLVLAGLGLPLVFCLLVFVTVEGPPPFLAALALQ